MPPPCFSAEFPILISWLENFATASTAVRECLLPRSLKSKQIKSKRLPPQCQALPGGNPLFAGRQNATATQIAFLSYNFCMDSPGPIATKLNCSQCGGELHPDEGQVFLTCPYCSTTVYVDKARVVFHWSVAPTLNEQQAIAALYRWMSGSQTVKDLDKKARVDGQAFQYFPLWYFKWRDGRGEEEALRPAAATSVTELAKLKIPAGDMKPYDPALDSQAVPPSVPLEAALEWLAQSGAAANRPGRPAIEETAVVHVPLFFYKYTYKNMPYTAVVDAASGTVLASLFPPKSEAPYLAVAVVTALVFLCLSVFPLLGALSDSGSSSLWGLGICIGGGIIAAPILFAWAFWVASKV
jgi:hypothetical protein